MRSPGIYSEDQAALAEMAAKLFADSEAAVTQNLADTTAATHVAELWEVLTESGLVGLPFSEDVGGGEGNWKDLAVLFREAGRALVPSTLFTTVFAATLLDRLGSADQRRSVLAPLLTDGGIATVAATGLTAEHDAGFLGVSVVQTADGWTLHGQDDFVSNAEVADTHIVAARDGAGELVLLVVPRGTPGVSMEPRVTFGGDSQYRVRFDGATVPSDATIGSPGAQLLEGYRSCLDIMIVMQAAEMLGGAEHVLDVTTGYVRIREQFGVAIGTFQAVQHRLADISIQLAAGEALWWHAAEALGSGGGARIGAAAANAWLGSAFVDASVWAHQLHGGIGFARENTLYLWSQRARQLELTFGDGREQLDVVATELLGPLRV